MAALDDFMSWLMGGTQLGNFLGVTSPTASTQTPALPATAAASPAAPALGGQLPPPQGGLLSGLLGGQQPVNPMSYFTPRQGLLGNSPLGMGLRGGLAGLAQGAGYGGLTGLGMGAMGGQQEELQRRQAQMQALAAGQQYQSGQQNLAENAIKMQQLVQQINVGREIRGLPDVTLNDVLTNPNLLSQSGLSTATTAPATQPSTATATNPPIVPTAQITNPNVTQAYPPGTTQFPPTSPVVTNQLPTVVPASGSRPPLALGGSPPSAPPPPSPSVVQPQQTTTTQPQQTTTVQPQQTTAQPSQAGGGTFTMPRTIQELEASNLPDWAKQQLYPAYLTAGYSGDYTPIYDAWAKVNEKLQAPAQAAAIEQAKVLATENLRPSQVKALGDVQTKYMADPVVQSFQTAQSIYRSGFGAYQNEQKQPSTQNELDLINSALQMMDQKAQPLRVGSADSMRQAENLPDLIYKSFQKLSSGGTLLPAEANALMDIINRHYQADQAEYNVHVGNYRQQAEYGTGSQPGQVPDALWRPDTPPPAPADIIKENPTTHERVKATQQWDGQEWVTTGWQPI